MRTDQTDPHPAADLLHAGRRGARDHGLLYMRLPALMGVGQYRVTLELPETGGLYPRGNVTYRGTQVGIVKSVELTDTGVAADLSLDSDITIPADLEAEVHSQSAVGELYVQLIPRSGEGPKLKDGDVIAAGPRLGADRRQHRPGRHQPWPARDPAGQPQDGQSTRPTSRSADSGPSCRRLVDGQHQPGHRRPREPRPADHPDRSVATDPRSRRPTAAARSRRGPRTWRASPASCRARTPPWRASWRRARVRPTRCGRCSTGCSPRCRSCWPTWSASAKSPSPISRASNSCWCCCRKAPPSRRPSAWPSGTPNRTTWRCDYLNR